LASPDCLILVALNDAAEPIGQVRFEREGDAAILSTSVALAHRGRRYGAEIVRTGSLMLFMRWPVAAVHAYVKTKNPISRRVFERAGFRLASREPVHGHPVWRFVLQPAA
jgi:RimJ/RimL family protein N-acetyltransferase